MRGVKWAAALGLLLLSAESVWAGWEIEQTNYNLRSSGKEIGRSTSTLRVSKDRARIADGMTISIFDYDKGNLALLLPAKKMYWAGTLDEYLTAANLASPKKRARPGEREQKAKPEIVVQETPITAEIAGKQTKKYAIVINGQAFQEIWVAEPFYGNDLDLNRYHAVQQRLAQDIRSSYGTNLVALADDPLYKKISTTGVAVRTHTYLGEAILGTEMVQIKQMDVPDSDFAIPGDFKRVPLLSLIDAQQALNDEKAAEQRKQADKDLLLKAKTPTPAKKSSAKKR